MKNKIFNYVLLLVFTCLVLYFSLKDDFTLVMSCILQMRPLMILNCVLLMVVYWIFKALIIKRYVNHYNKDYNYAKSFKLQMKTMFFNGITPFSSGGQPFQVLSLKKDGVSLGTGTNIIIIASFIHQLALWTFMTIAIVLNYFLKLFPYSEHIRNLCIFGYVISVIFILFLVFIMFSNKINKLIVKFVIKLLHKIKIVKEREALISKWYHYVDRLCDGSKMIKENKKEFFICYIYNMIALFAFIIVPFFVARGMNIKSFNILDTVITTSYVEMVGMFVPIPGGTGGIEYAFSHLYNNFVLGGEVNSIMLVWRFITYYLGIILGGIVLNLKESSKK